MRCSAHTTPSADFCAAVRAPCGSLSPSGYPWDTAQISWGKPHSLPRTPAGFTVQALDGYGLRDFLPARPTRAASYPVAVRQVAISFHASFRRSLAVPPLRFTRASPPSGCTGDFHPQTAGHAQHTGNGGAGEPRLAFTLHRRSRRSHACLFDLHTLLPVPPAILRLGPTDPEARRWLAAHWGITDRLRQVVARAQPGIGRRLAINHAAIGYGFFTDGETPHRAIAQLGARWPALRFVLVPRPDA
jgi:hypothetical protein